MFLAEPRPTNYDLHFNLHGIRVRVHPFFWLLALIIGVNATGNDVVKILIWISSVFLSITIHEMGHSLAFRRYGIGSHIVLYHFGGLAIPDSMQAAVGWGHRMTPKKQMFVSFAGPGAQFIIVAIIILVVVLTRSRLPAFGLPVFLFKLFPEQMLPTAGYWDTNPQLHFFLGSMLWINFYWAVMNLLPIYPLDGGQIARELFVQHGKGDAIRSSLILSVAVSAGVMIYGIGSGDRFLTIMFLVLGLNNYMALQQLYGMGGGGIGGGGFGGGGFGGGGRRPW